MIWHQRICLTCVLYAERKGRRLTSCFRIVTCPLSFGVTTLANVVWLGVPPESLSGLVQAGRLASFKGVVFCKGGMIPFASPLLYLESKKWLYFKRCLVICRFIILLWFLELQSGLRLERNLIFFNWKTSFTTGKLDWIVITLRRNFG